MSDLSDAAAALAAVAADHAAAAEAAAEEAGRRAVKAGELAVLAARVAGLAAAFPPPGPDPAPGPVPVGATTVVVGGQIYPLAAVNPVRGPGRDYDGGRAADELVAYAAPVEATATNRWGVEVTVAGGRVSGVFDRQTRDTGPTPVPAGGLVLSGHGAARVFLLSVAVVGADVTFGTGAVPGPVPPARERVRLLWQFPVQWGGPDVADWPDDVVASVSHVSFTIGQSAQRGTGRVTRPADLTTANAALLRARGIKVGATIGGSNDGGITIVTPQHATELVESVKGWPIDFLDIDLEPSGSNWTSSALIPALRTIAAAGPRIAITSGLYTSGGVDWVSRWGLVARALGDSLLAWTSMLYDFPESGDSRLNGVTVQKIGLMREYVKDSKIVLGYMPRPEPSYANASPAGVIPAAYAAGRKTNPDAGWALWESKILAATGWRDLRALANL